MSSKFEKEKEKEKKKKEKKLKVKQKRKESKLNKNNVLSKLDKLDSNTKEESRAIEEKLMSGIIKSTEEEKNKEMINEKSLINKVKERIEKLREIKQVHTDNGYYEEALEISNEIISIAFSNNLKDIITEEQKFLTLIETKINQNSSNLELNEQDNKIQVLEEETPKEGIIIEKEPNLSDILISLEKKNIEIEKVDLEKEREIVEEKKLKLSEDKETMKWEKEMLEEVAKFQIKKDEHLIEDEVAPMIDVIGTDERERFEEEKQRLTKETERLKQERQKFEEEKETFRWEKEMMEELKSFEREKVKAEDHSEVRMIDEQESKNLEKEKSNLGKLREKLEQEQKELAHEKKAIQQEKLKIDEEKRRLTKEREKLEEEMEAFKWERQMFEEVKKFEREKKEKE